MDFQYRIPGTTEPEITIRRSALGNVSVIVGGQELKRRGRGMVYDVPLPDGTTTTLEVTGQWRGLKAKASGVETALEPPVSPVFVGLIMLPLGLVLLGGLIGGVIGVFTSMTNMVISRRRLAAPLKLVAMILVAAVGTGAVLGIGFLLAPLPRVAAGDCLNAGLHAAQAGGEIDPRGLRPVDCASPHEDEVVATIPYTAGGSFPGMEALLGFAQQPCRAAFESYVGISFDLSVLNMVILTPTDLTWVKGDRDLSCIALSLDGSQLTGSVRGTAR